MTIALIIAVIISAIWFWCFSARAGWYGVHIERKYKLKFDEDASSQLLRIIARYRAGEFLVEKSMYGENLLFTKPVKSSNTITEYSESKYFINIEKPFSRSFGWVSDESHLSAWISERSDEYKGAINNDAFDALIEVLVEISPETIGVDISGNRRFRKSKNEEVQLS
ncbi:putative tail protein [Erwinia phage pEa_SNUABM_50]|uniref:Uncharacterized protein n=4 Tax=Eneladusvirus BF TaxID=2560751 RepID=A0A1S6UAI9_9CAUD|nr:membrane protein [Serratia phage BF]QOI71109.1 putative tail protein [Erwinia phage pEa_SNUABM_12]QOI71654.1 putative tail protein [Erwinia phage pEa_SNUABM_47]QOI72193.1 putative tail protein [Erwinia phage pEa_SNUABM_50]QXO11319.1 hypothetical protein pEaSNUABM19_00173 [Erwinia phage pEa_SNUABM_19]QXO11867.1 hypothetical protein pEaSNUABM44_00171 [Erwinia phage pEa_SNUABM_44]QXO12419.1 hypothetical protein pEaSNUABM49_00173 [Erwinia phage pEa_SNUABM_49]